MATDFAEIVLLCAAVYAGLGLVFAIGFSAKGAGVIDPVARQSPWSFRVLIIPASAALWPYLLVRWAKAARARS